MSQDGTKKEEKTGIREIFGQLDEVVKGMEKEDVSLEASFDLYHKGMDLLKLCNEKIDRIEKKMIMLDDEGEEHGFEGEVS